MKYLRDILKGIEVLDIIHQTDEIEGKICFDSSFVEKGDIFIAFRGTKTDGHIYIPEVSKKDVTCIICEELPAEKHKDICYVLVKDSHRALAISASNFYNNPSRELKLTGVTGTNGKTTIASLLYTIFEQSGFKAGLISTIDIRFQGEVIGATHTTPDPVQLNRVLREMADSGCAYVFMEVSSHAVHQKRIDGLEFSGGIFTNLSHEHLDYHNTFDEYLKAKKRFFDLLDKEAFALINADDRNGRVMLQNCKALKRTYGLKAMTDFKGSIMESHLEGNLMKIDKKEVWTQLPGRFNAYNIMAVYGAGILLGIEKEDLLQKISECTSVEGRFEIISGGSGIKGIVDYAHTPDAVENVLETIHDIRKKGQKIITVIGSGGDRDKTKRPKIAAIAVKFSDRVILTSDNPRFEDPEKIIDDMMRTMDPAGKRKLIKITDREEAIKAGCAFAGENDIILVAGKGHETYQDIMGHKKHFDDREILREYLKK